MINPDNFKLHDFCVACGKGEMESTGVPIGSNYPDIYYCQCKECGYRDASFFYSNLNYLTESNPLRAGWDQKTDGI